MHLIDAIQEDVVKGYQTIRKELKYYHPEIAAKSEIIALNKCDALTEDIIKEKKELLEKASGKKYTPCQQCLSMESKKF